MVVGTEVTVAVALTLGNGTTVTVLAGGKMVTTVVSHGTSVVYELVTRTGEAEDTLMVQGQAGRRLVLSETGLGGRPARSNLRRVMVVAEVTV